MASPEHPSDEQLARLYQQRKQAHPAPALIKRQLVARYSQRTENRFAWRRLSHVALAASTLLLCSLLFWHQQRWQDPIADDVALNYTSIELHSLAAEKQSTALTERYARHYQDYLSQQQLFAFHHKKHAILSLQPQGWQLHTCDQQIVQVSAPLIDALRAIHQIEGNLHSGDNVEVWFDKSGIILGIRPSQQAWHC